MKSRASSPSTKLEVPMLKTWLKKLTGPRMRSAYYGIIIGLIVGARVGVWMTSQDWLLPKYYAAWMHDLNHFAAAEPPGNADPLALFNTSSLTVPRHEIFGFGPPKDSIPSLTDPAHVTLADAGFLEGDDRVIGLTVGKESRAYPVRVLTYHQVINDRLGDTPIAVVYCPFCDSVSVMDRRLDGKTLEFGVSGQLLNSNSLFYDRGDNALWSQVGGTAISGPFAGRSLPHLNSWEITNFAAWRRAHAESTVLSDKTGYWREYRDNPYASYAASEVLLYPVSGADDRLGPRTPVLGVQVGKDVCAFALDAVRAAPNGRIEATVGGQRVVLAADTPDREIAIVEAPPQALAVHTFWFAWTAFHHGTPLVGGVPVPAGPSPAAELATQHPSP